MHSVKLLNTLLITLALLIAASIAMLFLRFPTAAQAQDGQPPQYKLIRYSRADDMEKALNKYVKEGWKLQQFGTLTEGEGSYSNTQFGLQYYNDGYYFALLTK
ncbi:MAG: hypothetical protein ACYDCO_13275 [Armatimonadota bacterium]